MAKINMQEGIGYTIVPDPVKNDVGPVGAMVFGAVLRYYMMRDGLCYASQQTIADKAKVSRKTANLWLQELVKSDYLRLVENERKYDTCIYVPTRKTGININENELEEKNSESDPFENGPFDL